MSSPCRSPFASTERSLEVPLGEVGRHKPSVPPSPHPAGREKRRGRSRGRGLEGSRERSSSGSAGGTRDDTSRRSVDMDGSFLESQQRNLDFKLSLPSPLETQEVLLFYTTSLLSQMASESSKVSLFSYYSHFSV